MAANLIHADPDEIAFVANTTTGVNFVAEGFPWREGDNVVTPDHEFPTNVYPWLHLAARGVETRRIPLDEGRVDLNRLEDACDERTRLISISWVGYASGWRVDVPAVVRLAHDKGALVFLDAIQGLGVFPLDVEACGVDFVAADGHKWLLGPEGAGLFYVRREHLDLLRPMNVGWNSVVHARDFSHIDLRFRPAASRYEGGSQNMCGVLGFGASMQMLAELGVGPRRSSIAERVLAITDYACRRLAEFGAEMVTHREGHHRSGIVAFRLPGTDLEVMQRRCLRAGVALSCRNGALRISPHGYATEHDIERLMEALAS
jgi:selenocysteine lyase/cysteine desulfurase